MHGTHTIPNLTHKTCRLSRRRSATNIALFRRQVELIHSLLPTPMKR
jgi:hypothetical protein